MIVKEKKDIKGRTVNLEEWKVKLQADFPFMEQDPKDEHNIYRKFGFECFGGWSQLIRDCCIAIVLRYAEDGIGLNDIDFEPVQIKEKFGTLRFYYGFKDTPCGIAAFDFIGSGTSLRFEPGNDIDDDQIKRLRHDIYLIVREAEEKSKHTCEFCGAEGELRNDSDNGIYWIQTLCEDCHERRIRKAIETREKISLEEIKKIWENNG